jgi:hypothetical protein
MLHPLHIKLFRLFRRPLSNSNLITKSLIKYLEPANNHFKLEQFRYRIILFLSTNINSKVISILIGLVSGIIRWLSSQLLKELDKIQPLDIIVFAIIFAFVFYFLDLEEIKTIKNNDNDIKWSPEKATKFFRHGMGWSAFSGVSMWIIAIINNLIPFLNVEILNNGWLNNFNQIVVCEKLEVVENDNIVWSLIVLLTFIVLNYWLFLEIIQADNDDTTENNSGSQIQISRQNKFLYFFWLFIITIIIILIYSLVYNNGQNIDNFYEKMNLFLWGILSLEIFVGLNVGLVFGFKKIDNAPNKNVLFLRTSHLIKHNNVIFKTFINSVIMSVTIGFFSSIICGLFWVGFLHYPKFIWWIFYRPENKQYGGILFGACVGLMIGILSGLLNGEKSGLVCIKYFAWRFILWIYKHIPWNYNQFLNDAVKVDFLKREIGGSYQFKDKELKKYLAIYYLPERNHQK